jgi:hypothetical protein
LPPMPQHSRDVQRAAQRDTAGRHGELTLGVLRFRLPAPRFRLPAPRFRLPASGSRLPAPPAAPSG